MNVGTALCVLTVLGLLAGCEGNEAKKASLTEEEIRNLSYAPRPSRADELYVSGEVITCDDVMMPAFGLMESTSAFKDKLMEMARVTEPEEFKELARPQVRQRLNANITNIILYRRAQRTLGDKVEETLENEAEKGLRRFVLDHGGNNAAADEALKAMGQSRTSYKQRWKRQALAEYAYSSRIPRHRPITYSELVEAYDRMKDPSFAVPGSIQFRLIDISVARMALADPNNDPVAAARALAESLVARAMEGEDFGELAREYSHGFRAEAGGLWTPRDPESLAASYTVLADAAKRIEVGEIAGPLEAPEHLYIMKLEAKTEQSYQPLAEVQDQVERQIATDRNMEVLAKLEAELMQQVAAADTDRFLDFCLERLYRSANSSDVTQ
jgi:parvulin-like peptidyl-prolyl isomerase